MGQLFEITPFTQLDFPGELACIAWFSGCNLRCVYCHNPEIVLQHGQKEIDELLSFLKARQWRLTGVVFSGGEATFCPQLPELARQAKAMGYKTKLDTNGGNPAVVRALLSEGLIDSVALDYKGPPHVSEQLVGTARFDEAFQECLDFLIAAANENRVLLEVRTTVHPDYLSESDLGWIMEDLDKRGYCGIYWLQNLVSKGEKTLGKVEAPSRQLDFSLLPVPQNFKLGFRNFPA